MSSSLSQLAPGFRPYAEYLVAVARAYGLAPVVTSTYRSEAEQARLYRAYVEGRSTLPAAKPGRSRHQYGLAVDVDLPQTREYLPWLGQVWRAMGGAWYESDPVHFEG